MEPGATGSRGAGCAQSPSELCVEARGAAAPSETLTRLTGAEMALKTTGPG